MGGGNMADMQRQILQNPQMMQEMMNSPAVQAMMNNPELMRNLIGANPQLQEVLDRNPELNHILNDPATLRQMMEAQRNPEVMREMMRNTDRAMSNIEAHPEGFNMLRQVTTRPSMSMQGSVALRAFSAAIFEKMLGFSWQFSDPVFPFS